MRPLRLGNAHNLRQTDDKRIEIRLETTKDDTCELLVEDNGVGFPASLKPGKSESLGLRLVTILAEEQLQGRVVWENDEGARVRVSFPKGQQ